MISYDTKARQSAGLSHDRTASAITSPPRPPVDIAPLADGGILLLPALWPVKLTPDQRRELARALLDLDKA